jgi:hypothetical protein
MVVTEQTIRISDKDKEAMHLRYPSLSIVSQLRATHKIGYREMPYAYYRQDEAGNHVYRFRSEPLKQDGWIGLNKIGWFKRRTLK